MAADPILKVDAIDQFYGGSHILRKVTFEAMAGEVLDNLARTVAAISSVLDPEFIVLGEGLDRHADFLIPALESRLEGRIHHVPTMTTAALESDAVVLGVAELAMRAVSQFAYLAR